MCFSAGVSFGASLMIGTTGVVAYKKANTSSLKTFAMIPIFFAIQQFAEGIVWSTLSGSINEIWLQPATYIFLIFAWMIWPIFIPFSLIRLESNASRKKTLTRLLMLGIFASSILIYLLFTKNISTQIEGSHIKYSLDFTSPYQWIFPFFYVLPVVFSHFVSSLKKVWYLGAINVVSYIFSKLMYNDQFISMWCFFAALSSLVILVIILETRKEPGKNRAQQTPQLNER